MTSPFQNNFPSADDLLLLPRRGILSSRSKAELYPFIYSAPMDRVTGWKMAKTLLEIGEIPVISRFLEEDEWYQCIKDYHSTSAFFGIGARKEELLEFIEALQELDTEDLYVNVAVDIAHGHSNLGLDVIAYLRELPFVRAIMSGSIATPEAAVDCVRQGATHLRVGIGPGSMCTTRLMTGVGVPNISAVYHIHKALTDTQTTAVQTGSDTYKNITSPIWGIDRTKVTIIADGGIRYPGDAVKYIAAGADAVMLGSVFAKCLESPGWQEEQPRPLRGDGNIPIMIFSHEPNKRKPYLVKTYRGQASAEFQKDKEKSSWCPEGASSNIIEWSGETVETEVNKFRGGMQSALSYLGMRSLEQLKPQNVDFIQITASGMTEGTAHGKSRD